MNFTPVLQTVAALPGRLIQRALGMFNLNDPRWGRDEDKSPSTSGESKPEGAREEPPVSPAPQRPRPQGANQGPPDLDELWREFNRKLSGLFGNKGGGSPRGPAGGGGGGFQPDMKSAGVGVGLIAAVALLIWLGTGFFIVQEGQQAVITQFGRYKATVGAIVGCGPLAPDNCVSACVSC